MKARSKPSKANAAIEFANHAQHLSLLARSHPDHDRVEQTTAVEAAFITPLDPVIKTADGHRLPAVPLPEAQKLNVLKDRLEGRDSTNNSKDSGGMSQAKQQRLADEATAGTDDDMNEEDAHGHEDSSLEAQSTRAGAALREAIPPSRTHPLFPPLPLYGPPSRMRDAQVMLLRCTSFVLSLAFLMAIVLGSFFTAIPSAARIVLLTVIGRDPSSNRPFYEQEKSKQAQRRAEEKEWVKQFGLGKPRQRASSRPEESKAGIDNSSGNGTNPIDADGQAPGSADDGTNTKAQKEDSEFVAMEGGPDPLVCDISYYARRVGLDVEEFEVQTEDGFIIDLYHVYSPSDYSPKSKDHRKAMSPDLFGGPASPGIDEHEVPLPGPKKYPVLMIHGLLQSMGAYCVNDDSSLAFYLCKQGFDVWLGNNRCGFKPKHTLLKYGDPRMWAWNIRQMGVMDLPALISRVLAETGFEKLGLVAHSQGTTQTFVALAKEQRPELGEKISVFCALAPAVYAGPLIDKMQFKWMRLWNPAAFRLWFGVLSFIPFMMTMHKIMPGKLYGALGYRVFAFLFGWSDDRWDRDLRDRLFQFSPVYVSSESMRWWLGRECFAKQRCILATREQDSWEERDIQKLEERQKSQKWHEGRGGFEVDEEERNESPGPKGKTSWYDERAPPFALWIAGSDKLVDGWKLLRRLQTGREPHVDLVHSKVIPEYEHLDVIWAMDVIEQVGKEVKEVLWKTVPENVKASLKVPVGCEELANA